MAQRIQAPMNAGLCLIISREGLSMRRQGEFDREKKTEQRKRLKARKKMEYRSCGREKKKGGNSCPCGHVISLL